MSGLWPMVGRTGELALIAHAARGRGGRARGVVISGSAGVGKTRLAREAVDSCGARDTRRHWIVGTASTRSLPLSAFAEIATDFGPDPMRRVREVIDALIGGHRDGEVVIGVDDAHLLDDLSAFTVHQLVTRKLATVVLTVRSGETPPDAVAALCADDHLEHLELAPLSLPECTALIERALGGQVHSLSAHRLWQYTRGNALYLRHLLDCEVRGGRLAARSEMWLWDGQPELSATLAELVEATIDRAPEPVRALLDALAVAEPLSLDVLSAVTEPGALAEAEALGVVTVDHSVQPPSVRLAHPMLGEVRRSATLRMRRLRGRIATELANHSADPLTLLRRAVLTADSDLAADPGLLVAATFVAIQMLDLGLAETLAVQSVQAGGGLESRLALVMTLTWQERGQEAERVYAELAEQAGDVMRVQIALLRALNFAVILGQPTNASDELDRYVPADDEVAAPVAGALRALVDVVCGRAEAAIAAARTLLASDPANDLARMLAHFALLSGLGEVGRLAEVEAAADEAYALADGSAEVSHLRVPVAFLHAYAFRAAGALDASDAAIARIKGDTYDVPFEGSWHVGASWHAFVAGLSALNRGDLAAAQRLCRESLTDVGNDHGGRMRKRFARLWLAIAEAMAGNAADARRDLTPIEAWDTDPAALAWHSEWSLAQAWCHAAEGAVSQAVSIARAAAEQDRTLGRHAWEVLLLQTATQFGDHTTADRLAALADVVEGPRAPVAAAHAAALAANDGAGLAESARRYEEFGDRVAAADAAAQAVDEFQQAGLRGAALTAGQTVARLVAETAGAATPAIRASTSDQPFTPRQREIISLAAQGLSNKQIADRLDMSVRSVEGHLFRASQRAGASGRDGLIALLADG